jgi:hypothetical protein
MNIEQQSIKIEEKPKLDSFQPIASRHFILTIGDIEFYTVKSCNFKKNKLKVTFYNSIKPNILKQIENLINMTKEFQIKYLDKMGNNVVNIKGLCKLQTYSIKSNYDGNKLSEIKTKFEILEYKWSFNS